MIGSEDDVVIGRDGKPAIGLDLGVELTGCPAGIAQSKEAVTWTLPLADRTQDLERGGDGHVVVHDEGRILTVIRGVQYKAAARFDGTAEVNRARVDDAAR